jgi:glycosyltransferase involved in cell wall biosynthesis
MAMESMRVIHISPTQFGSAGLFGGGERYPIELARALAGHVECELVTFGKRPFDRRESGGLRIRCLRSLGRIGAHPAHPVAPLLPAALRHADIVHSHQMRGTPSRIAALGSIVSSSRPVVTDHGLQGNSWGGVLARLFDRFLTVSAYSARELRAPPERTRIIYGGADPSRFMPDPSIGRRGVLFVGRITPHKGIDRLIKALPGGVHLTIAGSVGHDPRPPESGYPQLLRQMAEGRDIEFLEGVADEHLPSLYRRAAVFVLPSVHRTCYGRPVQVSELLGLAVLEAMSSWTPVICSDLGGLPEIVQDGKTGYLVQPGNIGELRDRLGLILADPALAARLGKNARDLVVERFTWQACAERCLEAYSELVERSPS